MILSPPGNLKSPRQQMCSQRESSLRVCVCVDVFFIHSSVDGHLGCVHILAILDNAATKIGLHVSFQISVFVFFTYIPSNGIAALQGSFSFSFLRNLHTVSTVAVPIFILTNSVQGFSFLHILTNICYLWSF